MSGAPRFLKGERKERKPTMNFGDYKQSTPSPMRLSAIIYAVASCVNLREELLALHASFPMFKTAMVASLTTVFRFLVSDLSTLFSRKAPF
jgi:hypothetical protein